MGRLTSSDKAAEAEFLRGKPRVFREAWKLLLVANE